jgi:small subunit ribosomal protein S18
MPRRKVCQFCVDKVEQIDYKDIGRLRRFVSDRGKIEPRRKTGTCAHHQRLLANAVKRARHLAMLPFTADHIRETGGMPPVIVGQPPAVPAPAAAPAPVAAAPAPTAEPVPAASETPPAESAPQTPAE